MREANPRPTARPSLPRLGYAGGPKPWNSAAARARLRPPGVVAPGIRRVQIPRWRSERIRKVVAPRSVRTSSRLVIFTDLLPNFPAAATGLVDCDFVALIRNPTRRCYVPAVPLPALTPEQRTAAVARATAARRVRADVRLELKENRASVSEIVERSANDAALAKLRVLSLLEAMPGIGKVTAILIMERLGIAQSRRLRGLGPHQVDALKREFG